MVHLNPKRLWGSAPDRPKANYPHQILVIEDNGVAETLQQREDRDDAGYWRAKAESLEEKVKELEKKVARLEFVAGVSGDGDGPGDSSKSAPAALAACVESADKRIEKEEAEKQRQQRQERKEDILQQLVAEMERLMEQHGKDADGDSETKGSGSGASDDRPGTTGDHAKSPAAKSHVTALAKMWESHAHATQEVDLDSSDHHTKQEVDLDTSDERGESHGQDDLDAESECSSLSDDGHEGPKMDTSTLERLLSTLLENEAHHRTSSSAKGKKSKSSGRKKKRKKKHKSRNRLLYQLSCKQCIGQNYVGSCKKDELKEKVKENYAVCWEVVKTAYGKGGGEADPGSLHEHSLAFRASSLAHHIAEHCSECNTEEETYQWCLRHVKVERISKHPLSRSLG